MSRRYSVTVAHGVRPKCAEFHFSARSRSIFRFGKPPTTDAPSSRPSLTAFMRGITPISPAMSGRRWPWAPQASPRPALSSSEHGGRMIGRGEALMIPTQRLPASLTPLEVALAAMLDGLEPMAPLQLPLAEALGCVAAGKPPSKAFPPCDIAAGDGWALRARDLVGASSYSPLPLARLPVWVEAGDSMPEGCDCVIDADSVDQAGPTVQV